MGGQPAWKPSASRHFTRRLQRACACPDPVDFRSYRSVNIYDEHNVLPRRQSRKRTPKPGYRDHRDHLSWTFEERNLSNWRSARTDGPAAARRAGLGFDRWATMGIKAAHDKVMGVIDPDVARYWRDTTTCYIMARDWRTLARKLRKDHITSGTMTTAI